MRRVIRLETLNRLHRKRVMMRGKNVQNESRLKRIKVRFGEAPKPARAGAPQTSQTSWIANARRHTGKHLPKR